jgi:hypothetical protein
LLALQTTATPAAALGAGTLGSAELLGISDRGVMASGKVADLIAVEGNPLEDPTAVQRVRWVMKGGSGRDEGVVPSAIQGRTPRYSPSPGSLWSVDRPARSLPTRSDRVGRGDGTNWPHECHQHAVQVGEPDGLEQVREVPVDAEELGAAGLLEVRHQNHAHGAVEIQDTLHKLASIPP